ncbi:MAG: cupin domain-containing protein, partial [Sphingomicrobium sp.]
MLVIDLESCPEFVAGDNTTLREVLRPARQGAAVRYSLAHAIVRPGETSLPHRLATSEVYYILEGQGIMRIDGEQAEVKASQTVYIPPNSVQSI